MGEELIGLIRQIIEEYNISEDKKGKWWVGTVHSVDTINNKVTLILPSQTEATQPISNKTNQTLLVGDNVYLFSPYGTIGSAWVAYTFKQYINGGGGGTLLDADTLNGQFGSYYLNWDNTTNKPTTLSGYGIIDATPSSHVGSTGNSHGVATTSVNGFMSSVDKTKLDGVATNANNYVHPVTHPPSIIAQDTNNRFVTDSEKTTWNNKASTDVATTSSNGLMSSTDKTKLNGIESGAQVNNISNADATSLTSGSDSTLHYHSTDRNRANHTGTQLSSTISDFASSVRSVVLTGLTTATNALITSSDSILSALGKLQKQISDNLSTLSSHMTNFTNPHEVTKTQVGLGNVTDESKATMFTSPTLTGTPIAPTATAGTNNTQIATTAFVSNAMSSAGLGDMLKSVYDTNNNGKVDVADLAESVDWANVTSKPTTFTPSSHTHGNITNVGAIGTTANLVVMTGESGVLGAKTAGTTSQYLRGDGAWETPANTTYAEITSAEITDGTSTTLRTITGRRAKEIQNGVVRFVASTTAPADTNLFWVDTN
jgi:adenosyl cobinamide kinase/adenosyl cobinamide phosphate guanylyltransferase